jgi:hypothetical protein
LSSTISFELAAVDATRRVRLVDAHLHAVSGCSACPPPTGPVRSRCVPSTISPSDTAGGVGGARQRERGAGGEQMRGCLLVMALFMP